MASPGDHNSLDADSAPDEHAMSLHAAYEHGNADASAPFVKGR
jgi:hypothetical protein